MKSWRKVMISFLSSGMAAKYSLTLVGLTALNMFMRLPLFVYLISPVILAAAMKLF